MTTSTAAPKLPAAVRGPTEGDHHFLALAAAVIRLLPSLSERPAARSIVKQLERCGPPGGANYEEARGAESPMDFIHKVRIALKEVRETR